MIHLPITSQRLAPYVISGATGVHVLLRMRTLSRQPATDTPVLSFLLKNTDVVLALSGASVVMWQLAQHKPRQQTSGGITAAQPNGLVGSTSDKSLIASVVHELRQVFTALLLGLGLIGRKADSGNTQAIPGLVRRLMAVVRSGIDTVNVLEPSDSGAGQERKYGA
jgi:hypothetical protein